MTRSLITLIASGAVATGLAAGLLAQDPRPGQGGRTRDVTLTGCLVQGSGPSVFLLSHARLDPESKTEQDKTYLVIVSAREVDLPSNLNHEVRASGAADPVRHPVVPPGRWIDEATLPRFHVKILLPVADRCA
jgi:hypothetical protein